MNGYENKDLMISAALLAEGRPLLDVQQQGNHLVFMFGNIEECEDLERKWWAGSLQVSATKYAEAIKRLKNLIHARGLV